jgi:DNA invertase Pin-like site-specific DNA recombinase
MKIAYSYTRFSSTKQKKGDSIRRQIQAAKEWCQNNGYTLSDDQFRDAGKSAFKGKNLEGEGDLKRFLSLIEEGKIKRGSVLILESFDRLSRLTPTKAVGLFLDIINAGIGMVFTMTFDKRLITEKMIEDESYILYAIIGEAQRSHNESKYKSQRVKEAYDTRKQKAIVSDAKFLAWCPPWCDYDKKVGYLFDSKTPRMWLAQLLTV